MKTGKLCGVKLVQKIRKVVEGRGVVEAQQGGRRFRESWMHRVRASSRGIKDRVINMRVHASSLNIHETLLRHLCNFITWNAINLCRTDQGISTMLHSNLEETWVRTTFTFCIGYHWEYQRVIYFILVLYNKQDNNNFELCRWVENR